MALSAELTIKLLGAIETDSLVFLCGAGLSIPSPSYLPSAVRVAQICYDKWQSTEALNAALRNDVDQLAGHFYGRGDFDVFLHLVPWNELAGSPNRGHAAVGDLLVSRAAHAAMSANFDTMVERWAAELKVAMRGALTGQEAVEFAATSSPLIKFHGCMQREPAATLWTQGQLAEPDVQARIQSLTQWMTLHLPNKHLVVVGFWTDWGYLNDVIAAAFTINTAHSVTVIDPAPTADLQTKAPNLWAKLTGLSQTFEHVQASAADVLDELRAAFSRSWARKFYVLAAPMANAAGFQVNASADTLSGMDLYNLRRDVEGLPYTRAATLKQPPAGAAEAALMYSELVNAGAALRGAWLSHGGRTIRIVNGAGQGLADVRERYLEPATIDQSDIVVCAGAVDLGVPAALIASGHGASIMRPAPGGGALWLTRQQAHAELGL
ncbi:MAG: hypothetical protein QOD42_3724 [Sphingomonadales bacterium]|jgi:hypothetical protein|nr:hypothetical protein [Sphingomonadales bacterium]